MNKFYYTYQNYDIDLVNGLFMIRLYNPTDKDTAITDMIFSEYLNADDIQIKSHAVKCYSEIINVIINAQVDISSEMFSHNGDAELLFGVYVNEQNDKILKIDIVDDLNDEEIYRGRYEKLITQEDLEKIIDKIKVKNN